MELRDALLVNPYDVVGVAEAIHLGLEMGTDERRERMQGMRRQVLEHNIYMWAARVLGDLRELRLEPAEATEVSRVTASSFAEPSCRWKNWHNNAGR